MSADRITALDITALTIAGTDYDDRIISCDFSPEVTTEEGKSINERYGQAVATKRKNTFSIEMLRGASDARKTALDMSVFTIGGVAYIDDIESFDISIDTGAKDGSGIKDGFTFPNSISTNYEIRGTAFVTTTALLTALANNATLSNIKVAVSITHGGDTFQVPGLLSAAIHKMERDDIQKVDFTIKGRGAPTAVTGHGIIVDIMTGDAVVTYDLVTGANEYSGSALITKASISCASGQIIKDRFDFECQGAPTIA
jgi:hypothetical protein